MIVIKHFLSFEIIIIFIIAYFEAKVNI